MLPSPDTACPLTLVAMDASHGEAVLEIYEQGIRTGHATFNDVVPTWESWDRAHLKTCRLVVLDLDRVVGWAALGAVSMRDCYRGVVEVSIYIEALSAGRGIGSQLMTALIGASEAANLWTLQAAIFPENEASIALHQKFGFRIVGYRKRLAKMTYGPMVGQWRDVVFLERRSNVAGQD